MGHKIFTSILEVMVAVYVTIGFLIGYYFGRQYPQIMVIIWIGTIVTILGTYSVYCVLDNLNQILENTKGILDELKKRD